MDNSNPAKESFHGSSRKEDLDGKHAQINTGSAETIPLGSETDNNVQVSVSAEDAKKVENDARNDVTPQPSSSIPGRRGRKGKKVNSNLEGKKYTLRSSSEGAKVLKSTADGASNTPPATASVISTGRGRKRKKNKRVNRAANDELHKIKYRVKYLSARMNYEQSLIEAYTGEGWKRQSAELVRPEKELERARSQISRCKLEVRDLFQRLDTLAAEGKLQESSFDSEGQINSDDIFCAKCWSKDFSTNNDIILCDGACNRGFHQMCLVPPLLIIPPGDEGWLCPVCDCKADCIDNLNERQGTNLAIDDNWEKVFPEAASVACNKQYDDLGLPSDDSEDDDYNPDHLEADEKSQKDSSSSEESEGSEEYEESDSSYASDVSTSSGDECTPVSGFSSDDVEDDDYDPDAPDLDENVNKEGSSSDESDFSSDTNDLNPTKDDDDSGTDDESAPNLAKPITENAEPNDYFDGEESKGYHPDLEGENAPVASGKRHRERLDYKKLNDEAFGNIPSDSSDDEDWTVTRAAKKERRSCDEKSSASYSLRKTRTSENSPSSEPFQSKPQEVLPKQKLSRLHRNKNKTGPIIHDNLESKDEYHRMMPDSMGKKFTTSGPGRYGREVSWILCESYKVNAHPSQGMVENLSKELGITPQQVSIWFEETRRSFCFLSTKEAEIPESCDITKDSSPMETIRKGPQSEMTVVSGNKQATKRENGTPSTDMNEHLSGAEVVSGNNFLHKDIQSETTVKEHLSEPKAVNENKVITSTPSKDDNYIQTNVKEPESGPKLFTLIEVGRTEVAAASEDVMSVETNLENRPEVQVISSVNEDDILKNSGDDLGLAAAGSLDSLSSNGLKSNNQLLGLVTPERKKGRPAGSTNWWNSAKFESKKRKEGRPS